VLISANALEAVEKHEISQQGEDFMSRIAE
jgi:hypothetical protein